MSSSVTVFEDEVDQLIESLITALETAVPLDGFRRATDDNLLATSGTLERLGRAVDARLITAAGELQHRSRTTLGAASLAIRKGCRDAAELLRRVTLVSGATARRRLKLGNETRSQEALTGDVLPPRFAHLAAALADGAIGVDAASAIVTELSPAFSRTDPNAIRGAEAELVAAATGTSPDSPIACTADEIRGQATVWRAFLDQDGTLPTEERAMSRRAFSTGTYNSSNGLVHGRYSLMPEVHAKLGKVFDACLTPKTGPTFLPEDEQVTDEVTGPVDPRTADQQRHDVFAAMIDGFARSGQTPAIGGASPTVIVSVSAEVLESGRGAGFVSLGGPGAETAPLSLRSVHQMICTGGLQRITHDSNGAIIQLGSEQRCFTAQQRRAITLRDGGCIIPGCTVPATWCEIHHVTPDVEGGPTHPDNGVLICWFHHRTIATSGWDIRMIDNIPHVKAPPWLRGDGRWHPATTSPTRQAHRLRRAQRRPSSTTDRHDGRIA